MKKITPISAEEPTKISSSNRQLQVIKNQRMSSNLALSIFNRMEIKYRWHKRASS